MLTLHAAIRMITEELRHANLARFDAEVAVPFTSVQDAQLMFLSEYQWLMNRLKSKQDEEEYVAAYARVAAVAIKCVADLARPEHVNSTRIIGDRMTAQGKGYAVAPKGASKKVKGRRRSTAELGKAYERAMN